MITHERPKGFNDRHDCGVIALAAVTGRPYEQCHTELAVLGRRRGAGTNTGQIAIAASRLGCKTGEWRPIRGEGRTARGRLRHVRSSAVLDHVPPRGRYLVCSSVHWFAVIDGVVHDNGGLESTENAWLQGYIQVSL